MPWAACNADRRSPGQLHFLLTQFANLLGDVRQMALELTPGLPLALFLCGQLVEARLQVVRAGVRVRLIKFLAPIRKTLDSPLDLLGPRPLHMM